MTTPKLTEAQVTKQICDFLCYRRWIVKRNNVGKFKSPDGKRTISVGERGEADLTATRPVRADIGKGLCHVIHIEIKARGERPSAWQETWLAVRRNEGYLAGWWESLESFEEWYDWQFSSACGGGL